MEETEALAEMVWRSPGDLAQMNGIHTNSVLFYFSKSPFFDHMSNNNVIFTQALHNPALGYTISTRIEFEGRLRQMQGLEYMVVQDPSEGDTKRDHNGVWVIQKQIRRKRGPGQEDSVTPQQTYYVVNENIYQAPTLGNAVSSKLLSVLDALHKFSSTLADLPSFSPSIGQYYIPPSSKPPQSLQTNAQSSKSTTPIAGSSTPQPPTSNGASTPKPADAQQTTTTSSYDSSRLFADAWRLTLEYGNDYMDENPVVGEPGNFKLSRSKDLALPSMKTSASAKAVAQPFKAVKKTAPPIKTDMPIDDKDKKSALGMGKSPITPGAGAKDKKARRKSKAAGVATPKAETPKVATPT